MSWKRLLEESRVERKEAGKEEIDDLRQLASRRFDDASRAARAGISADAMFIFAYDAARAVATMAVRAEGYRVKGGHAAHLNTFLAVEAVRERSIAQEAQYFESCRQRRNEMTYDRANVVSAREAEELLERTKAFSAMVEHFISRSHPELAVSGHDRGSTRDTPRQA